jgi:hypothetical protein
MYSVLDHVIAGGQSFQQMLQAVETSSAGRMQLPLQHREKKYPTTSLAGRSPGTA